MQLTKYLHPGSIIIDEGDLSRDELLGKMCDSLRHSPAMREREEHIPAALEAVKERELAGSTGLGGDFAFPHARVSFVKAPAISLAILKNPVDFGSNLQDGARLVCMVLAPEEDPTITLKVMAQVGGFFSDLAMKEKLQSAKDSEAAYELFKQFGIRLDVSITAKEVMREPLYNIHPNTQLREVTSVMTANNVNAIAVVEEAGNIVGHITCNRLFHFGLPDFFSQLKSVSFIREFDPFEKYFFEEAHSKAGDLMTKDFFTVAPDATLLEIVFALTTLAQPKVYVVDNNKLVGVIDQGTVLNRIVNF